MGIALQCMGQILLLRVYIYPERTINAAVCEGLASEASFSLQAIIMMDLHAYTV